MFLTGIILGLFIGANVGLVVAALLCAASKRVRANCLENAYDPETDKARFRSTEFCDAESCLI